MHSTIRLVRSATLSRSFVALLGIIVLGFGIRIAGVNWDEGMYIHPDERHIVLDMVAGRIEFSWPPSVSWLDPDESPINPRPRNDDGTVEDYAYGTLPVYTVDIVGKLAESIAGEDWDEAAHALYVGRGVSVLLDTVTILTVFLIGAQIAGRTAGLLGATIYAFLPIAIQSSHFFTVDSWLTCFLFAGVYSCMRAARRPTPAAFALTGLWFGLAMASKSSAAPFGAIILLTLLLTSFGESANGLGARVSLWRFAERASAATIAFLLTFFIGAPFAFIDPDLYVDAIRLQANIQSGQIDTPFTQQYVNTIPFSYQLEQAVRFGMGPVAVLLGVAGTGVLGWMVIRLHAPRALILGAWMAVYLAVMLFPETKFMRYLLPLAPALAVTAGLTVAAIVTALARRAKVVGAVAVAASLMAISTGYGAAYSAVTSHEHTRISASVWMIENLPPGSTTSSEIWDDRLPMTVGIGWSTEMRRIDDVSINHFLARPTLGDLTLLSPALSHLPIGEVLAANLASGDISEVVDGLRGYSTPQLNAIDPVAFARFQSSLLTSAAAMTTSPDLSRSVSALSHEIALEGTLRTEHLNTLAMAIERAFTSSTLSATYDLLNGVDYYVLASNRVQRAIEQNPWRYAVPIRMYELLDGESIGFDQMARFTSQPELFGVSFPDKDGDESYLNYDHPAVTIYQKSDLVPFDRFVQLNGAAAFMQSEPERDPETEPLTFEEPVSDRPAVDDARWSETVTGSSWGAASVWIVMLVALQLAALPVARTVFRSFPDRGWGSTRLVGVILPATVIWWLASVGILQFRAEWVLLSLALFALAGWLWLPTEVRSDVANRARRRLFLTAEVVFWVTFALFLLYRMINPDSWHPIWGGEKPMEFAQINAILRTASFPPPDPWYAGGFINYYYYGFYLTAWLIKLTGIPIEYAFNLAQPTFVALLASTVFSTGAAVGSKLSRGKSSPVWSGLLAVLLVSFAGNMRAVGQLVASFQDDGAITDEFGYWVWAPSRAIEFAITEFPYFTGLYADLHPHVVALPITVLCIGVAAAFAFDGIRLQALATRALATRVIVAGVALGVLYPTNAWDLPVYAALVAVSLVIGTAGIRSAGGRIGTIIAFAGVIGGIALMICLPFLRHYEALFGSIETVRTNTTLLELESHLGGQLLILTAAVPMLMAMVGRGRQLLPPIETFLLLLSVLLIRWACVELQPSLVPWLDDLTVVIVAAIWLAGLFAIAQKTRPLDFGLPRKSLGLVVIIGGLVTLGSILIDRNVMALYLAIAISVTGAWLLSRNTGLRFVSAMIAAACFTGAGIEIFYLVDDLTATSSYRMNTVFKFYNQIWVLLGITSAATAGAFLPLGFSRLVHRQVGHPSAITHRDRRRDWSVATTVIVAVVLLLTAVYPVTATSVRLGIRFPNHPDGLTLNAYAWMDYGTVQLPDGTVISFDEDRDVIDWFNHEVEGTPVIAEAAFGPYRCNGSRISIGTGLPSVLGWQRHEEQQRNRELLPERDADLRTLYGSDDISAKLQVINDYDIQYIVVGELERNYPLHYTNCTPMDETPQFANMNLDAGIAAFEKMEGSTLEVAFRSGDTIVYRVVGNS